MKKKVTIIHTTMATVSTIPELLHAMYDGAFDIVNMLDDSLLNEIKMKGDMTTSVIERFVQYAIIAKHNGSDAILLACSSIGRAGDVARQLVDIPLFKIDEPMAEKAVGIGGRILVLGTVQSTLTPTSLLIKSKQNDALQSVDCHLIPNVFELYRTDKTLHDQTIAKVIDEHMNDYDVIVLAQASMADAVKYVSNDTEKIVTSLPLGLQQLRSVLDLGKDGLHEHSK